MANLGRQIDERILHIARNARRCMHFLFLLLMSMLSMRILFERKSSKRETEAKIEQE